MKGLEKSLILFTSMLIFFLGIGTGYMIFNKREAANDYVSYEMYIEHMNGILDCMETFNKRWETLSDILGTKKDLLISGVAEV